MSLESRIMSIIGILANHRTLPCAPAWLCTLEIALIAGAILDGTRNVVKLVEDGKAFEVPASTTHKFYKKLNDHLGARKRKSR